MLGIQRFVFNSFLENTYIIWDQSSKDAAIIDPGCYDAKERETVDNFIIENSLRLKFLVNTHCHIDHIFGNAYIKVKYNPVFLAPETDLPILDLMMDTAKSYNLELTRSPNPDKFISEHEPFELGELKGKFLFTPGHTPGEFCLYFEKEKVCFTGDVLFKGSIGRTDLWGGGYSVLIGSIKTKLFNLPDDVKIYPGHESESIIGEERKYNPFFK